MSLAVVQVAGVALPHLASLSCWRQVHQWVPIGLVGAVSRTE